MTTRPVMLITILCALAVAPGAAAQSGPLAFTSPRLAPLTGRHIAVALGDFDGDGAIDAATADASARAVTVLTGDGSGGFRSAVSYPLGHTPRAIAAGDVNNDSAPDLVVATEGAGVLLLRGAKNGAFATPIEVWPGVDARAVAVADLDGDGFADVVIADAVASAIVVRRGDGSGAFGAPTVVAAAGDVVAIAAADVNADGALDLIAANRSTGTLSVLIRSGAATFVAAASIGADAPRAIAAADVNGDRLPDLLTASIGGAAVGVMLDGAVDFGAPVGFETGGEVLAVAAADLNGDTKPDIVAATDHGIAVLLNVTDGAFDARQRDHDSTITTAAAGDVPFTCDFTWIDFPGSRNWADPNNWSPYGVPGPASTACIGSNAHAVFITLNAVVGRLYMAPGAEGIELRARLDIMQEADINRGITVCGRPTGELALAPGAIMRLHNSVIETINNPLTCSETSKVIVPAGATLRNESGFSELRARVDFGGTAEAAAGRLKFRSPFSVTVKSDWNAAVLSAAAGATIELGGTEVLGPGTRKVGAGLLEITGDQRGELSIDGPARLAPMGRMTSGTTIVTSAGSIEIAGNTILQQTHQLIVNGFGTIDTQGIGGLCLMSAGTLDIAGTVEMRGPEGVIFGCGVGAGFVRVRSTGVLAKRADSTGLWQILANAVLNNDGRVLIDAGQLKMFAGSQGFEYGQYVLGAGTIFERAAGTWFLGGSVGGPGTLKLTGAALSGTGSATIGNADLTAGLLSGNLRLSGSMAFSRGSITGTFDVLAGATLTVPLPQIGSPDLTNASLVVHGTVAVDLEICGFGSTQVIVAAGGRLHFRRAVIGPCGGPGTMTVFPGGTLQVDDAGDRQILWFPTTVFGKVEVTSGTLRVFRTNQWMSGSELAISGGATVSVETFSNSYVQQFSGLSGVTGAGTLNVNGAISGSPTLLSNVNLLQYAAFQGPGQADAWGTTNIFGGFLTNGYVLNLLGTANLVQFGFNPCGGQIRVGRGQFYLRAAGLLGSCASGQGALLVMPNGTLVGAAGAGASAEVGVPLTNQGTVRVESGRLRFFGPNLVGSTLTGGSWVVLANAELSPFGFVNTNAASVSLEGAGANARFDGFSSSFTNAAAGHLAVMNGATLTARDFTNQGDVTVGANSTFDAQTFVQTGGTTTLGDDAAVLNTRSGMPSIEGGLFAGVGVVRPGLRNAGGTVRAGVGNVPGVLDVDGAYVETADGVLKTFLRSATEYSVLHVTGLATFGGTLHIEPWTETDSIGDPVVRFMPAPGDSFQVVTHGGASGAHAQVVNAYFTEFNYFINRKYNPTGITLVVEPRMIVDPAVKVTAREGETATHVVARFADLEFGRTDPAAFSAFVFWSDMADASPSTLRYDLANQQFVLETTRSFVESGPVDLSVSVGSNGSDGQGFFNVLTVNVDNLPPHVTPAANQAAPPGQSVTLTVGSFADPGILDTHVAAINWGDGAIDPGVVAGLGGAGTVTGTHTYERAGRYTVTVIVTDDEGAAGMASFVIDAGVQADALAPASAAKSGAAFLLTVAGKGFTPGTQVLWNGAPRPTMVISSTELHADIPVTDLAIAGEIAVALVTVRAPSGLVSNALAFTIAGGTVTNAASGVAAGGDSVTVTATEIAATLKTADRSGPVSVTAAKYGNNPTGVNALNAGATFFDLLVGGSPAGARLTAHLYYPAGVAGDAEAALQLLYFDGASWQPVQSAGGVAPVKDTTDNLDGTVSGGRFVVVFEGTSTPPIAALTGTVVAIGTRDTTAPTCAAVATPRELWPPNGQFVNVTVAVTVADSGSGPAGFTLASMTSNEGRVSEDVRHFEIGTPDTSGQLRARRSGNGARLYTLTYKALDAAMNQATCQATVVVPHDRGNRKHDHDDDDGDDKDKDDRDRQRSEKKDKGHDKPNRR